jgi:hypothetical protein
MLGNMPGLDLSGLGLPGLGMPGTVPGHAVGFGDDEDEDDEPDGEED